MIENYKIITITHKSAEIKDIGNFVIPESNDLSVVDLLKKTMTDLSIKELMYLPTCNRVMFFFCYDGSLETPFLTKFTQQIYPQIPLDTALDKFRTYEGEEAIEHLFEVSASVDSLVVGEREIIRQLREAYQHCSEKGLTGDCIRLAMDMTVKTAKHIYGNTRIGQKQVSVVSLAIKKMLEAGVSNDQRLLIVGAGQTNLLVCKFLKKYGFKHVSIFNRSVGKAQEISQWFGTQAHALSELSHYKKGFDCIVVCTGSVEPIIHEKNYHQLLQGETDKKVIVDLAIPNNVSPSVSSLDSVDYIEIEDLKKLAKENMAFRRKEIEKAKEVIVASLSDFHSLYAERQLELALEQMPIQIKEVKSKALNEVFKKEMEHLDDDTKELLERMMTYMEKKCIGIPMKVAKETILS